MTRGTNNGGRLYGNLVPSGTLSGKLSLGDVKIIYKDSEIYEGEYSITPKVKESSTLQTKGMTLLENVVVLPIPVYQTSNTEGTTFIIGGI